MNFKIGDVVKWCWSKEHQNTWIIVLIDEYGVVLKQNFGRGTILSEDRKDRVKLSELNQSYTISDNRDYLLDSIL